MSAYYNNHVPYQQLAGNVDHRWDDFNMVLSSINTITVANKISLIKQINLAMNVHLKATQALKAELVARIQSFLRTLKDRNDVQSYIRFKEIAGPYLGYRYAHLAGPAQPAQPARPQPPPAQHASTSVASSSNYNMARAPTNWASSSSNAAPAPAAPAPPPPKKPIKWKNSPLLTVLTPLTDMTLVKESQNTSDRITALANFTIPPDIKAKVEASVANPRSSPQYSIRLLCTSGNYYTPTYGPTSSAPQGLPVEFPLTCEVRVNYELIAASLKGVKKKPGSCPPADLMKGKTANAPLLKFDANNRIELVHVNPSGPQVKPRYFMQACLIETINPDDLLKIIQKGVRRPKEKVEESIQRNNDDAEIQMGASSMSLKCPLSYIRMTTPIRSEVCDHIQCFEAFSWLQINEQTPTWSCPVCEKTLSLDRLFLDDFTDMILKTCDSEVDDVIIEPDASWHTLDRKYGTAAWLSANPPKTPSAAPSSHRSTPLPSTDKGKEAEVYLLSSDDENEAYPTPSNVRSTAFALTTGRASLPPPVATTSTEPIDLTLDSDDEDVPRPAPASKPQNDAGPSSLKRSAPSDESLPVEKRIRLAETGKPTIPPQTSLASRLDPPRRPHAPPPSAPSAFRPSNTASRPNTPEHPPRHFIPSSSGPRSNPTVPMPPPTTSTPAASKAPSTTPRGLPPQSSIPSKGVNSKPSNAPASLVSSTSSSVHNHAPNNGSRDRPTWSDRPKDPRPNSNRNWSHSTAGKPFPDKATETSAKLDYGLSSTQAGSSSKSTPATGPTSPSRPAGYLPPQQPYYPQGHHGSNQWGGYPPPAWSGAPTNGGLPPRPHAPPPFSSSSADQANRTNNPVYPYPQPGGGWEQWR